MVWHRPDSRSFYSWPGASFTAFWSVLVASPAASCSFVNPEASILAPITEARFYWIGTALFVIAIFVLDFWEKRISLDFVLGVIIVSFHPAWTIPPIFHADCTFENINASQWAVILLMSALILRVSLSRRRRKVVPALRNS